MKHKLVLGWVVAGLALVFLFGGLPLGVADDADDDTPKPLMMKVVENMSTPDIVATPGNPANGHPSIQFNSLGLGSFPGPGGIAKSQHMATLHFLPQQFFEHVFSIPEPLQVKMTAVSEEGEIILNITAGSRIIVTFDGGKKVTIFLPAMTVKPVTDIGLFPATDGSTYFDEALTQLAQKAPEDDDEDDDN